MCHKAHCRSPEGRGADGEASARHTGPLPWQSDALENLIASCRAAGSHSMAGTTGRKQKGQPGDGVGPGRDWGGNRGCHRIKFPIPGLRVQYRSPWFWHSSKEIHLGSWVSTLDKEISVPFSPRRPPVVSPAPQNTEEANSAPLYCSWALRQAKWEYAIYS